MAIMAESRKDASASSKGSSLPSKLFKTGGKNTVARVSTSAGVADCTLGRNIAKMELTGTSGNDVAAQGGEESKGYEEILTVGTMRRMQGDMMHQIMQGMKTLMNSMRSIESYMCGMELRTHLHRKS